MTNFLVEMARANREEFMASVKDVVRTFTNFQEGYILIPTKTGRFEKVSIGDDELKSLDNLTYIWDMIDNIFLETNNGYTENNPFKINGRNVFAIVERDSNNYRLVVGELCDEDVVRIASNKEVLVYLLEHMDMGED